MGAILFAQTDGKPNHWNCLIGVIIFTIFVDIAIVVIVDILLSSKDEINEPIVKEPYRTNLLIFLGVFTLTFCFGCWCCFCCGGFCCHVIFTAPFAMSSFFSNIAQRFILSHKVNPAQRLQEEYEDHEFVEMAVNTRRKSQPPSQRPHFTLTDMRAFENRPGPESFIESEAANVKIIFPGIRRANSIDVGLA